MAASFVAKVFSLAIYLYFSQFITCKAQNEDTTQDEIYVETSTEEPHVKFTEIDVLGFRLWQIAGMVVAALVVLIVIACCFSQKRIPRTKKEIEARYKKKLVVEKYANEMSQLRVQDLPKPPPEQAHVEAEIKQVTQKKRKATHKKGKAKLKGKKGKPGSANIEDRPLVHNPVSSDPALTADPKIIEQPLGGHHAKPGQSARQHTLSNI